MLQWLSNASSNGSQPWRKGLVVGLPQATDYYTRAQLMDRDIIGLYTEAVEPTSSPQVTAPTSVADLCRSPEVL